MNETTVTESGSDDKPAKKGSLWRSLLAVLWAFVGLRKGSEFEKDIGRLTPFHLIGVGLVVCLVFVVSLMFFVKWVVAP